MKIETLKHNLDIVTVVESYTELKRAGHNYQTRENPLREEKTASLYIYTDTQRWFDFGSGEGGDIVDFIKKAEDLNTKDAVSFLKEKYLNVMDVQTNPRPKSKQQTIPVKKNNDLLFARLEARAKVYLAATHKKYKDKWSLITLDINGIINKVIRVSPIFEKLFEGYLIPTDEKYAKYLFNKVIGYDSYYNCPAIIIRNESEIVVDIVKYRPERNGKPLMQGSKPLKYMYSRNEEKPDGGYIFPLQAQMIKIIQTDRYCYVGEGLKNAINASLMGIPFISIEGAGKIKPELIEFLKSTEMKDIIIIGAFDGDKAGETAYKKISKEIPMENEFDFTSGIDFTDFVKDLRQ